ELGYCLTPIRRTGQGEGPAQRPWPHQERRAWNRAAVSLEGALWALESHFPGTGGNGIDKALARCRRRLTGVSSLKRFFQEHEPERGTVCEAEGAAKPNNCMGCRPSRGPPTYLRTSPLFPDPLDNIRAGGDDAFAYCPAANP